jgi:ABC-type dipeptide/oligopeptide/nickel transport system ATPase component
MPVLTDVTEAKSSVDSSDSSPLLAVRDLKVWFDRKRQEPLKAVDGLSYTVEAGRARAIVGESGSGKTVAARAVLGLLPGTSRIVDGEVAFEGRDLRNAPVEQLRKIRGREIAMVFQNASEALNPTLTLERQLTEHLLWHRICSRREAVQRAVQALDDVGIPEPAAKLRMYPFQLSGGMRQRAMLAVATVTRPKLLIADEPTTAVDVTVQRQVLDLLQRLKDDGMAIVMITHDLGVARAFCDDVTVMYQGRQVEEGPIRQVIDSPQDPYTQRLLESTLEVGHEH